MEIVKTIVEAIKQKFPDQVLSVEEDAVKIPIVNVKRDRVLDIMKDLKTDFDYLSDVTAVDYQNQGKPERFAVAYNLYSIKHNARLRIKAWVPETDPSIASVSSLWKSALWGERESFDMMGIKYVGHPDLRRILLPFTFQHHPHRKEYPVTGVGERDNFPKDFSR